jgi:hypothetical protein
MRRLEKLAPLTACFTKDAWFATPKRCHPESLFATECKDSLYVLSTAVMYELSNLVPAFVRPSTRSTSRARSGAAVSPSG